LARRSYKGDKRRKELNRLKKQAEKREKRFTKKLQEEGDEVSPEINGDEVSPEINGDTGEAPEEENQPDGETE
jgi:hypothetical protein